MSSDIELRDSNFGSLWLDIEEHIQTLDLPRIREERRVRRKLHWDQNIAKPFLLISLLPEQRTDGPIGWDDVTYRYNVSTVMASNGDPLSEAEVTLYWRKVLSEAFHHQKDWAQNPVRDALYDVEVEPGEVMVPAAFLENVDAQAIVINCMVRELRP